MLFNYLLGGICCFLVAASFYAFRKKNQKHTNSPEKIKESHNNILVSADHRLFAYKCNKDEFLKVESDYCSLGADAASEAELEAMVEFCNNGICHDKDCLCGGCESCINARKTRKKVDSL